MRKHDKLRPRALQSASAPSPTGSRISAAPRGKPWALLTACALSGLMAACDGGTSTNADAGAGGSVVGGTPGTGGTGGSGEGGAVTGGSAGGNTGGDVGGNTGGNTGGNAGGNAGGNTGGDVGGNAGGDVGGNTGGNTGGNAGGDVGGNTGGTTGGTTGGNIGGSEPPPCPDGDADRDGVCDPQDGECNLDGQPALCNRPSPACPDGTVPEVDGGCYTDRCVSWAECGAVEPPPVDACTPVAPGEFGDCRALLGWASNGDGTCGIVGGCGCDARCVGRVFESEEACLLACVAPPDPARCGGFAGLPCAAGEICIDDPTDDCDPQNGGADCGGLCIPGGCPDADADGQCDAVDPECNADGSRLMCRRAPPDCPAGTVPEVRDGCYTNACVAWDACGVVGPPPGFCGGIAGFACAAGEVCVDDPTDDCDPANGGADCIGLCVPAACPDTDGDGACDADDSTCNADGSLLMCRRVAPDCMPGTVPEVRNGCYTDVCLTWDACGGELMCVREPSVSPRDPMFDRYEGTGFPNDCRTDDDCFRGGCSGEICSATQDVASTCEGIPLPEGNCGCVAGQCFWNVEICNGGCPDTDGDGACDADDTECNADGSAVLCLRFPPACRAGTVPVVQNGCYTDACVTWPGCAEAIAPPPARCGPVLDGEFGLCDAIIGFGVGADGTCRAVSGCGCDETCAGRVFETPDLCEASCGVGPVPGEGQMCGGFAGFACPAGLICVDAPNDACDPANGGADCPGLCTLP
jgi:eight-cysteine-cluster-containing protein